MHLCSWTAALSIITVIYFALVLAPPLHSVSGCLICRRPLTPDLHQLSEKKSPLPLKLLSNCKTHSLPYDSQCVLQVFLIRITAVGCNCNAATLRQQNRCTYPSFCPILHVGAALSGEPCSYPLCCTTGEPIISILASDSEESLMILGGIN